MVSRGKTTNMKKHGSRTLTCAVLVIGFGLVAFACTKRTPRPLPAPATPTPTSGAVADKTDKPAAALGSLPAGIDLGKLDEAKRKIFDAVVNREPSACGKGHSLLHSAKNDPACRASFYAVRYVARLANDGLSESEIGEKLEQRFRTPRVPYIDVSDAPSKGNPAGKVKIVEFADYECDHCKRAQALMHEILAEYSEVTLYFKHFPFAQHTGALNAARAAAAAQKQGKFWQYNDLVWENFTQLTPATLESIAKTIGLDFSRWIGDVGTDEIRAHVQRDKTEGVGLEIHRTPAIFINGRRYDDEPDLPGLKDWIDEELGRR
jgi:predicted DsbA family dithiol-disulfide isomerase